MTKQTNSFFTIQMTRALEDNAFATGVTICEMMEVAGKVVSEEVEKFAKSVSTKNIAVFAGYGNNGGDGVVALRHLLLKDYDCSLFLFGEKSKFNSLASQENFKKLSEILPQKKITSVKKTNKIESIFNNLEKDVILIDALLGIGITGTPREPYKSVINYLNSKYKGNILALDIPSGYNPEEDNELYVRNANKIVCLGRNKIKEGDFPKAEVIVREIGIPIDSERTVGIGDLKWFFPKRRDDSHKRQNGVVTVIAGSKDYIGAPVLAGMGAFRTGADLIFILTPTDIRNTVASFTPDLITIPAHEGEIESSDITKMYKLPRLKGTTFIIGPGMLETETTKETLLELLRNKEKRNIIIDASALSIMDEEHLFLLQYHNTVLTPHKGEFTRIFKRKLKGDIEEDCRIVSEVAMKWQTTILLKGHLDIISDGNRTKINKTGHAGMTVGGTGDVLSGIVAALLSVNNDPFLSGCLGAYISGKAGEFASERYGVGLIASDIPE
ncbi:MAG: NAD(P)H-hydrate dehydratase, partial [Candidatus Thorarchaeota archaeon]